jgi:hypothetical protein
MKNRNALLSPRLREILAAFDSKTPRNFDKSEYSALASTIEGVKL